MISILSDAAFSRTICAGRTIPPPRTISIISVCLTTQMNPSTQSAQPCLSLYLVGITTAYSWGWGRNIHCWVFLHLLKMVSIAFPVGRCSWYWRIWFGGIKLKYITGTKGTWHWKVLSRSLAVYWIQMLWDSKIIPWLALVYSTLQSSPRHSTDVGQWNGWQKYNSPLWSLINILSMSTFWSYPTTSPRTLWPQSSSICAWHSRPKLGIPKSSDASLSKVNLILLYTPQILVPLKWCTCCDMGQKNVSSWQYWTCKSWLWEYFAVSR